MYVHRLVAMDEHGHRQMARRKKVLLN